MTRVSKGVQAFNQVTKQMLKEATSEGKNLTKAQVTSALGKLTEDGKVSRSDRQSAEALLDAAPLTAGAREALENFVSKGDTSTGRTKPSNVLNSRIGIGGGESSRSRGRTGGGESSRAPRVRTGGGESGGGGSWLGNFGGSYGGGSYGGGE